MRRIPLAVILFAVLLAAGCTKEVPQTGSLDITSTPAGLEVQVILDGNFRGVTPLLLANLSAGYHLLQLRAPGYPEKILEVTVNGGERMRIAADYPPLPVSTSAGPTMPTPETTTPTETPTIFPTTPLPNGALYVTSFPSGATIYLNGRGYGVTPRLIQNLTPGSYELRLSLVGWKDYRVAISISPGLRTDEEAILHS